MKEIPRDTYLQKLIRARNIDLIKVITGIRRCGKSYLLDPIFKNYLINDGVPEDHIIELNLEDQENVAYRDADALYEYVKERIKDNQQYFALIDEIQLASGFESVLNSFLHIRNLDTYVTGSNSRFLSSDIITEFRGRSIDIHMYPLSFSEFCQAKGLGHIPDSSTRDFPAAELERLWKEYYSYGGLPQVLDFEDIQDKITYLKSQKDNVYLNDIIERYNVRNAGAIDSLTEILASAIGSPTNPNKLERTFKSLTNTEISYHTIEEYLKMLENAFLIEKSRRYDVKGKRYIDTPAKYYFSDAGIRNSFIDFRQTEETHLMENIIYNELRRRGYQVDVGAVNVRDQNQRKQLEVDFVASFADRTYYIQSVLAINDLEKREQESRSLNNIPDHFSKIIIAKDIYYPGHEFSGIATIGLFDFLLNEHILEQYK